MPADTKRLGRRFDSAVLTWIGNDGFPFSVRCRPIWETRNTTRVDEPDGLDASAGPASLLYHSHNSQLWKLRMLLAIGEITHGSDGWRFRLERIRSGVAGLNKLHWVRSFFNARRTTKRYLVERRLSRPEIPWRRINQLKREA
jgi:hypothetical protein